MTAFARSDINSICIPAEIGGCGETHARKILNVKEAKKGSEPEYASIFGVTCPPCEPILLSVHGWVQKPEKVELTPDEQDEVERQEKEGTAATAIMASKLGEKLAEMVKADA